MGVGDESPTETLVLGRASAAVTPHGLDSDRLEQLCATLEAVSRTLAGLQRAVVELAAAVDRISSD